MELEVVIACSTLFVATHLLLSHPPVRRGLISAIGEMPFRGLYSLVALTTFGGSLWAIWGSFGLGPQLFELPRGLVLGLSLPLMLLALVLVALATRNPSPAGMIPGPMVPQGILRITRHPMNIGLACFAAAHMVANPHLGDLFFFGSFLILGSLGVMHQDRRKANELGQRWVDLQQQTSILPFLALIQGRTRLSLAELSLGRTALAIAAFVALIIFHARLFGVPVL